MLRFISNTLIAILLLSCGRAGKRVENQEPNQELRARYQEYLALGRYGWDAVGPKDCDALLFASLSAVAHNREFNIEAARAPNGQWFRLPTDSFKAANCSSTISRDMFMGVMVYALHFKRLDLIQQIGEYGRANNWKMGSDTKFDNRTFFLPATIALLYRIESYLGGVNYVARFGAIATPTEPGYQSHLGMLQLYILGKIDGELDGEDKADLDQILGHSSQNPLAHALRAAYGDGNYGAATALLLKYWPAGRLPTTADWADEWRTQRDDASSGLLPSGENPPHEHSGADFLFAAGIVLGEI